MSSTSLYKTERILVVTQVDYAVNQTASADHFLQEEAEKTRRGPDC
jgi:hypothetical protein